MQSAHRSAALARGIATAFGAVAGASPCHASAIGALTVPFIEVRDAGQLQDVAVVYPDASPSLRSGDVTTTGPATLVAFWWGDATGLHHSAVPGDGFTLIENFVDLPPNSAVQCAVAVREVAGAGTYHVTWATSPAQGAPLWLFAFQSGGDTIFADGVDGGSVQLTASVHVRRITAGPSPRQPPPA
jgi:hypothetical protein